MKRFGILVMILVIGVLTGCQSSDPLEPWEQRAKEFLENSYVEYNPDELQKFLYEENVESYSYNDGDIKRGQVAIASKDISFGKGTTRRVYFLLPNRMSEQGDVMKVRVSKVEGKWKISEVDFDTLIGKASIKELKDEIKKQDKYKGRSEWKNAELQ